MDPHISSGEPLVDGCRAHRGAAHRGVEGASPTDQPADPLPRNGLVLLWAVRIGIALVLLTPLVVRLDLVFPWVVGKSLFARSIIEIAFAFWAALVLLHRRYRPSRSWVLAAFAVWLLVSCLAAVFGVSPGRSMWSTYERMQGVFDLFHWFAFTLMARSVLRNAGDWRLLLGVNLVSGAAVCALSLVDHYGLIDAAFLGGGPEPRLRSTLGNPLYLGPYVTLNALLGAALFVQALARPAGPVVRRIGRATAGLYALIVLVNLWTMWLSGTRTAIAGLGAASLVLAVFAVRSGVRHARRVEARRIVVFVVVLIVSAVVLVGVATTTTILEEVVESSVMLQRMSNIGQNVSARGRIDFAAAGMRAFLDRPLFGWGPENFLMAWGRHNNASAVVSDQVHNKPVEELATKGIVGLLSYLALWAAMMSAVFLSLRGLSGRGWYLCLIGAALVAGFVVNLFQIENPVSMMQFSLLAALAASIEAPRRSRGRVRGADPSELLASGLPAALRTSLVRFAGLLPRAAARPARVASALVAVLAMLLLVHLNVRTAAAAAAASRAITPSRPWSERLDDFTRSIGGFPALGNNAREFLLEAAALSLGDMSEEEFQRTVELVALELERGSAREPQNWLLQARAVIFYQLATTRDREYVEVARRHVDRAAELAPRLQLVTRLVNAQETLEAGGRLAPVSPD